MPVKQLKVKYKWKKSFYPIFKIDHMKVTAFTNQNIITLHLLFNIIYIELNMAIELTTFKIGIGNMYIQIGGGVNE